MLIEGDKNYNYFVLIVDLKSPPFSPCVADPLLESNDTTSSTTTLVYNETMTTNEPPSLLLQVETELINSSEIMLLIAGKSMFTMPTEFLWSIVNINVY